ncbi:MAG: hypothetical protein LBJ92_01585 [Holosporales bacterium]|jgi:hypothetical protein|nr:hypothetical protein [Holosporales bacterium]
MKQVASAMRIVIGSYNSVVRFNILLRKSWNSIAGEPLDAVSAFVEAKFVGVAQIHVIVDILSAAAIMMKHKEPEIIASIMRLTGVTDVHIICRHRCELRSHLSTEYAVSQNISAQTSKEPRKIRKQFHNEKLKYALEILQTELLSAA